MLRLIGLCFILSSLTGCASFDQERAAEQRKSELCAKVATQHLSHCAGNHVPPPPVSASTEKGEN